MLQLRNFAHNGYDRRNANLKKIRNILVALMGETRNWEVLVGQTIASINISNDPHNIGDYLGEKVVRNILNK